MKQRTGLLLIIFLVLVLVKPASVYAAGKVVIVSLNRTSLAQVAANPSMTPWLVRGSTGLLNISTASKATPEHLYVTMGAGSRALGAKSAKLAFQEDEEYSGFAAGKVFMRHTGNEPDGKIVHLGMAEITQLNQTLQHPVHPGLLGETLRQHGKVTAVIGNSDGQNFSREATAFLADSSGQVVLGDVSRGMLKEDDLYPFGWRTDREKVWWVFESIFKQADVVLVDWGDFSRLDEYRELLSGPVSASLEQDIFHDVSWFLTRVFVKLSAEDVLLVLSPAPPTGESGGGQLGYLVAVGGPFPPGALLSSATTRRPGLAAITDVAPLVLEQTGLGTPGSMLGRTVNIAGSGGVVELLQTQKEIDQVYRLRPPLLKTYVFFQIVFVLGALFNIFARLLSQKWFEPLLLGLLTVPPLLLVLPLHLFSLPGGFAVTIAAVLLSVVLLQRFLNEPVKRFFMVAASTSIFIVMDLLRGAPLMKMSVLGYDPVSGARYYGLGNEYMGILVGATVLGGTALISLFPGWRRFLLPLFAFYAMATILLIVAPSGGANFGGTVTALVAFPVALAVLAQFRPGWKSGIMVLTVMAVIVGIALFINVRVPQTAQSHLGRTVTLLQQDGWQVLQDVVSRKAAMNVKLFRYSQWSRAFLAFLAVLTVLFYRPRGVLRDIHRLYAHLTAGFLGIIAGSAAAFLMNDSGVVAAATTLLYAGVPIILLAGRMVEQSSDNCLHS